MKHFLLYIISFACDSFLFAQFDSTAFIIGNSIQSRKNVSRIIYLDSSIRFYQSISQVARHGKVEGYLDTVQVFLTLSKREIKLLDTEFKTTNSLAWKPDMFENSLMITDDSLKIFSDRTRGRKYFEKTFAKKYFLFSKPIFIRNNSIAVFRLAEMYEPSSGYDLLYFYQKIRDKWQQYIVVPMGAW